MAAVPVKLYGVSNDLRDKQGAQSWDDFALVNRLVIRVSVVDEEGFEEKGVWAKQAMLLDDNS